MKIMALIPARGGSQRVPKKNVRLLGGDPLINWTIKCAHDISELCDVLVSTDDKEIAEISRDKGALVPWLRPHKLSTNTASSVDVALHALDWYEHEKGEIDGLLLLQPTSPFRTTDSIKKGIDLFIKANKLPVVGVTPTHFRPNWLYKIEDKTLKAIVNNKDSVSQQSSDDIYVINGSFYLISPHDLRKNHSFILDRTLPLVISEQESLDIDTEWDLTIAGQIAKQILHRQ